MSRRHALVAVIALVAVSFLASELLAGPPGYGPAPAAASGYGPVETQAQPYLVLKGENVGAPYPVSSPAYAYGWFGVCPRARHVYDGTGYYNHYSQSSIRRGY